VGDEARDVDTWADVAAVRGSETPARDEPDHPGS
jgi:hypothetical protein